MKYFKDNTMKYFGETLINPSYRRKPVSITLKPLDSGIRRNDGDWMRTWIE